MLSDDEHEFAYLRQTRKRKGIKLQYKSIQDRDKNLFISDSEDGGDNYFPSRETAEHRERDAMLMWQSQSHYTRLVPGAFRWLRQWFTRNSAEIDRLRAKEREQNQPQLRKLALDLKEIDDEISALEFKLKRKKKEKRQIKRQLLVLVDDESLNALGAAPLEDQLFTFLQNNGRAAA